MRKLPQHLRPSCCLLAALLLAGCVVHVDDYGHSTFTIVNDSDYALRSVFVAFSDGRHWGRDLLGRDAIFSGESFTVETGDCAYYDVRVVDEYDVACDLYDVYLCDDDDAWIVTNRTLDQCAR